MGPLLSQFGERIDDLKNSTGIRLWTSRPLLDDFLYSPGINYQSEANEVSNLPLCPLLIAPVKLGDCSVARPQFEVLVGVNVHEVRVQGTKVQGNDGIGY